VRKIWFISDYHLNHIGALNFRTQYSSVEEMNEGIIKTHNFWVHPRDTVYHIGDFIWKGKPQSFLERLNGTFYIIKGNHDRKIDFTIKHKVAHVVDGYYNIKIDKQDITLCHFPMISWNRSHFNSWHLYGHHHTSLPPQKADEGKKFNVNFDVVHRPLEFEEINVLMNQRGDNWDFINKRKEE